jgi:hypothetical protein
MKEKIFLELLKLRNKIRGGNMTVAETYIKGGSFLIQENSPENIFTPEDFTEQHQMIAQTTNDFVEKEVFAKD